MPSLCMAIDDSGIENFTEVINETYDNGEIQEGLQGAILTSLPKKQCANDC